MSQISRATAKSYFVTGATPTQQQFADLIDSIAWYDGSTAGGTLQDLTFTTQSDGISAVAAFTNTAGVWTPISPNPAGTQNLGKDSLKLPAGVVAKWIQGQMKSDSGGFVLGLNTANTVASYGSMALGLLFGNDGNLYLVLAGTIQPTAIVTGFPANKFARLIRTSTGWEAQVDTDGAGWTAPSTVATILTSAHDYTADVWPVIHCTDRAAGKLYYPKIFGGV